MASIAMSRTSVRLVTNYVSRPADKTWPIISSCTKLKKSFVFVSSDDFRPFYLDSCLVQRICLPARETKIYVASIKFAVYAWPGTKISRVLIVSVHYFQLIFQIFAKHMEIICPKSRRCALVE